MSGTSAGHFNLLLPYRAVLTHSFEGDGSCRICQSRRFEADLLHGPADDKWHLIDTEFLDTL